MASRNRTEQGQNRQLPPVETRWQPGQSGNPNGRPKGLKDGLRARLMKQLKKEATADVVAKLKEAGVELQNGKRKKGLTNQEAIAAVLTWGATLGNMKAIRMIFDNTEAPLPREIDLGGDMILRIIMPKESECES